MTFLPLVLLPDEVLLRQVDEVDHWLGRDEEMLVQNFNLKKYKNTVSITVNISLITRIRRAKTYRSLETRIKKAYKLDPEK